MRSAEHRAGTLRWRVITWINVVINVMLILIGMIVFFSMGSFESVAYIIDEFAENPSKRPFACAS